MLELKEEETRPLALELDPVDQLHKHREEIAQKYPTFESRREYYKQFRSVDEVLARIRAKKDGNKRN